jgi:hypothetical protein
MHLRPATFWRQAMPWAAARRFRIDAAKANDTSQFKAAAQQLHATSNVAALTSSMGLTECAAAEVPQG